MGFVNESNWPTESGSSEELASHVLVFMVIGVNSHLKMSLGYFPTMSATSISLFHIFWRVVGVLEIQCDLKACTIKFSSPYTHLYSV